MKPFLFRPYIEPIVMKVRNSNNAFIPSLDMVGKILAAVFFYYVLLSF
jgi:hypothetical protein